MKVKKIVESNVSYHYTMQVVPMDAFPANMVARKMKKKTLFEEYFTGIKSSASEVCPIKK